MTTQPAPQSPAPVRVIVPVYRDLEATRRCLESLAAADLPENASVTLINDASPEPALGQYCEQMAQSAGFTLLENEHNLGFVRTANKGFALDPEADILLLNSDTMVAGDWIQRLQRCAYCADNIGTVTPFSNNGTICSYPVFPLSNDLPQGWSCTDIDRLFQQANDGQHAQLPTAVGFCMYIKRACLTETGYFDEENFGLGYGEECDFSVRASALGWQNVLAADVFVFHEGGASFAGESSDRKRQADKVLHELHPHYDELVLDFIQRDPLYELRSQVDALRLKQRPEEEDAIFAEHHRYSESILQRLSDSQAILEKEKRQRQQLDTAIADAQAMLQKLNRELTETRRNFNETDVALTEAQGVVETLNSELQKMDSDLRAAVGELYDTKVRVEQLTQQIELMEGSRSWRYTAWMRRKKS